MEQHDDSKTPSRTPRPHNVSTGRPRFAEKTPPGAVPGASAGTSPRTSASAALASAASSVAEPAANRVLLTCSLANWIAAFLTTSINIALPTIQTEFKLGAVALGWLPLVYVLATAVFLLPLSKVADIFGRRRMFVSGLALVFLSTLMMVFAKSYAWLVFFRLTQGIGSAMIFATSTAIVTLAYPVTRRGWAMGILVMAAYLGQTLGPVLGGVLVHNVGWRSLFIFAAVYMFANLTLDLWLLRRAEWHEGATSFDWKGSLVYGPALAAVIIGLSWLPTTQAIVLFSAGAVGMAFFLWWESRSPDPLIELGLFRHNRLFALSNLAAVISYVSVWGVSFLMSLYLQFVKGLSAQTAGFVLITGVALQAGFSPVAGRLADRVQARWLASFGMGLCFLGLLALSFLRAESSYGFIIVALCLLGLGYAFFSGPNQASIMGSVERRQVTVAGASLGTMRVIGQSMSIAIATLVLALVVGRQDIRPADYPALLTAARISFAIMTALCLLGTAVSLVRGPLPRRGSPERGGPAPSPPALPEG
jgi:MFS family permease